MDNPKIRNKFSKFAKPVLVTGPGRTQQHFKDECDINKILAKYRKTGVVEHVTRARAIYGDFSQVKSAAENFDIVAKATAMFDMIPATIRNQFGNDIPSFLRFIDDPANFDQCVKWGIYDKPKVEKPSEAPTPAPPAEPAAPEPSPEPKKKKAP